MHAFFDKMNIFCFNFKNAIENKKSYLIFFSLAMRYEKMLQYKIVCSKEAYKLLSSHFLIRCIFFCFNLKKYWWK